MIDLLLEISQTLRNNKLRTALTGFAVAWGIFMLIVLLGMSHGIVNSFEEGRMGQGANSLNIWAGKAGKAYNGLKEGRTIELKETDMGAISQENRDKVSKVTSQISGKASVISSPFDYVSTGYNGVYPDELENRGQKITEGRFINNIDMERCRKVIVLTRKNADVLFPEAGTAVGSKVTVAGLTFTVIGIYDPEFGENTYIPFTTAAMLASNDGKVSQITVNIKDINTLEEGEEVEREVRNTLSRTHDFSSDDISAVIIWNKFTQHIKMSGATSILGVVVWLIGLFTMLSGIIGVSNIMFVSVRERTHEIGIRRAIGAKPRNILVQILTESVAITAIFGYIGIFFGILVTEGIDMLFAGSEFVKDPTVDISLTLQVTVVLIVAGAMAGLFPALKALKVKPVEALRDE